MVAGPGFMELIVLLMMGGGVPLGVPPLAEDAKLAQIAPQECIFYMNWNGVAKPDPKSTNGTERLAAEKEVQQLISAIDRELTASFKREMRRDDEKPLAEHLPFLMRTLLMRQAAVYISDLGGGPRGPTIEGALVVNTGDLAGKVKNSMSVIEQVIRKEMGANGAAKILPANEGGLRVLPTEQGAPQVAWGMVDQYFVLTLGTATPKQLTAALAEGKTPKWYTKLRKALPVERPSTVTYVDLPKAMLKISAMFEGPGQGADPAGQNPEADQSKAILAALGVDKVESVSSVTGLEGDGYVTRSLIGLSGEPTGIMKIFAGKSLTAADLQPIPADATLAMAMRIDLAGWWKELNDALAKIDPNMSDEFAGEVNQMERKIGVKLKDLFASLETGWCVYNSPGEGGLVFTGLTAVVPLKDAKALRKLNETLVKKIREETGPLVDPNAPAWRRFRRGVFVKEIKYEGQTIYFANSVGEDMFIAPAWCITDSHLVISGFPQQVKAYLSRAAGAKSIADNPQVAALLKSENAPSMLSYLDTPRMVELGYPFLQIGAVLLASELQREGISLDSSLLPSAKVLLRHLKPDTGVVYRNKQGIVIEGRQTIPSGGSPGMLAMMLPVGLSQVRVAQGRAQHAVQMNNLRQVVQACIIYELDNGKFPDRLDQLGVKYIEREMLFDPQGRPFVYHGAGKKSGSTKNPSSTPLVSTQPMPNGRRIIAYMDGHVETEYGNATRSKRAIEKPAPVAPPDAAPRKR